MALKLGDKAVSFNLPGVDGTMHSLHSYGDKQAVAVVFTCNHCPYAQALEQRILDVQRDYADKGVQVVAINPNDANQYPADSFENMKKRAKENNWNIPYLYDESQEVARAYGAERTPEIFLFNKNGLLVYHGAPDDDYDDPNAVQKSFLRDALDAVLAGKNPPISDTTPVGCTIKWK